jgi:hypothetical protein
VATVGIVLFWVVLLSVQVAISVHLIRKKPPRGCSDLGAFSRVSAIGCGFIPIPLIALAAQLAWYGMYRLQLRKLPVPAVE